MAFGLLDYIGFIFRNILGWRRPRFGVDPNFHALVVVLDRFGLPPLDYTVNLPRAVILVVLFTSFSGVAAYPGSTLDDDQSFAVFDSFKIASDLPMCPISDNNRTGPDMCRANRELTTLIDTTKGLDNSVCKSQQLTQIAGSRASKVVVTLVYVGTRSGADQCLIRETGPDIFKRHEAVKQFCSLSPDAKDMRSHHHVIPAAIITDASKVLVIRWSDFGRTKFSPKDLEERRDVFNFQNFHG